MAWTRWKAETRGVDAFAGWSDAARLVITHAMEHARARGVAGVALSDLAVAAGSVESIRSRHLGAGFDPDQILAVKRGITPETPPPLGLGTAAREAVEAAREEAVALGHATILPVHVWLGVLSRSSVRASLAKDNLTADLIRRAILESGSTDE